MATPRTRTASHRVPERTAKWLPRAPDAPGRSSVQNVAPVASPFRPPRSLAMKTCSLLAAVVLSAVSFAAVAQTAPASAQTAAVAPQIAATERPKDSAQTWLIEFDRTAQSDGTIAFRVWPYDRAPVDVFIQVKKGDTENAIALAFRDAFRKALGVQDYQIN